MWNVGIVAFIAMVVYASFIVANAIARHYSPEE